MGNKMNKILPGLFIGSARDAHDVVELRENKISHILSVLENFKPEFPTLEYMVLPIADSPSQNIACYFSQCNIFIHKARRTGNVLVHCQMGVSRSAAIVVAYIMTVTRLSWKNALAALKAVRPFVSPNLGFQMQLMAYGEKFVEEERTRLKVQFPLSQFNDIIHCEQLLETYRLSLLRNEQPMDVDVYPLALNAYGSKDFASISRQPTPPTGVIFCGHVADLCNEEDCLSQRFGRIQLSETFGKIDTFSCGPRPSSVIVAKRKAPELNTSPSSDDELAAGWFAREKISGNYLLSTSPNGAVQEDSRSDDQNSSDAATLEMLFSNSINILKNSANNDAKKSVFLESSSLQRTEALDDAVVDRIFLDSVGGTKNSIGLSSEAKGLSAEKEVSDKVTESALREIGRAYLRKNVRIWRDMTDTEEDDDDKILSAVRNLNSDPSKSIKITRNLPAQNKIPINDPTQLTKITSNDPCQATIKSNGSTEERLNSNSEEVITLLPSQSQLDLLFDG